MILGDPPIEWENVHSLEDLNKWGLQRDSHAADVLRREVLSKNRRALVIYGDDHLSKKNRALGAFEERSSNLVGRIESSGPQVFVIHTETRLDLSRLQDDVNVWPKPSLALLQGTIIGGADFEPGPRFRPRRIEELFDAILYLGHPSDMTFARLAASLCSDSEYVRMRTGRLRLLPGPPGRAPPGTLGPLDRFKRYCDKITR